MALLFIILGLLGFAFLGLGSGSSSVTDVPLVPKPAVVKCSARMTADQQKQRHCFPPANP